MDTAVSTALKGKDMDDTRILSEGPQSWTSGGEGRFRIIADFRKRGLLCLKKKRKARERRQWMLPAKIRLKSHFCPKAKR